MSQPLADLSGHRRSTTLRTGAHILGPNGLLRRISNPGRFPEHAIFSTAPSGTGKRTIANIIAKQTQRKIM